MFCYRPTAPHVNFNTTSRCERESTTYQNMNREYDGTLNNMNRVIVPL